MTTPLAYLNGEFVPFATAGLPLHDAGFVSGATVVDNARTFGQRLFRWPEHLARFRRDCADAYVPLDASDERLTAAALELVEQNARLLPPGGELQLVTFATPGPLGVYLGEAGSGPPTLGMATYPLPFARYRRFFAEGVTLAIAGAQISDPGDLVPPRLKHRSRLSWYVAERRIHDPESAWHCPGAVPVVVNALGIGDTAIGGILGALDGTTVLLPVAGTVLDSISVRVAAELCASLGLHCEPLPLDLRALSPRITELMLAGTGFCLAGVRQLVNGPRQFNFDWPGPIYRRLLEAWSTLVSVDITGQFEARA